MVIWITKALIQFATMHRYTGHYTQVSWRCTVCNHFHGHCGSHVAFIPGIRFSILNKLTFQVTWLQERHALPLCRSCGLIPDMHLTNYYETEWVHLLDIRNRRKLQHTAILSGWRHFCMLRLSKNSYLDDSAHKLLMIPHTNFEMFDDSPHKFWRMIMQVQH